MRGYREQLNEIETTVSLIRSFINKIVYHLPSNHMPGKLSSENPSLPKNRTQIQGTTFKKNVVTLNLMWGFVKTATRFEYLTIKRLMKTDH